MRRPRPRTSIRIAAQAAVLLLLIALIAAVPVDARTFRKELTVLTGDGHNWIPISVVAEDASLLEGYSETRFEILPIYASADLGAPPEDDGGGPVARQPERLLLRPRGVPVVEVIYDLSNVELPAGVSGYHVLRKPEPTKPGPPTEKPAHWQQDTWILDNAQGCVIKAEAKVGCHTAVAFNGTPSAYHSPIFLRSQCPPQWIQSIATYYYATVQVDYSGEYYNYYKLTLSNWVIHNHYYPGGPA